MAHGARETDQAMPTLSRELHAAVHADAPAPAGPRPVLVLASPAPIPLEVIITWLRKEARRALLVEGGMVEMSALTAQRIAAELEARLGDSSADGRRLAVARAPGESKARTT